MTEFKTILEQANSWARNSVTLKLAIVCILTLLLLIPSSMIQSIIGERESLHEQAVSEISASWAQSQQISGPILSVPLNYRDGTQRLLHLLPETLDIDGSVDPENLRRGIYDIIVYRSQLALKGTFKPQHDLDSAEIQRVAWDQAFITLGISDLRGIEDEVYLQWHDQKLTFTAGSNIPKIISSGITTPVSLIANSPIAFNINLRLQGSQSMSFLPLGNITAVTLESPWSSPSFQGTFLPDQRQVNAGGFNAHWKILQLNRNYPSSWIGDEQAAELQESAFGVDFMAAIDDYQKSMRMSKYAVMTIALTFLAFFLVEILNGKSIHPFQYSLVGLALCLFYILLVSISEHSNFELAYLISSLAIVVMITLYMATAFKSLKLTVYLASTLCSMYGFMFVIMQLTDYALLIGSIGLFLILGATMYFTRKIDWYRVQSSNRNNE